ncbi:MAG: hypothetical protein Kilf2KO_46880 [Rhodospirillales bacterium]
MVFAMISNPAIPGGVPIVPIHTNQPTQRDSVFSVYKKFQQRKGALRIIMAQLRFGVVRFRRDILSYQSLINGCSECSALREYENVAGRCSVCDHF